MNAVSTLNPTQIHLLKMFSYTQTDESTQRLKKVLFDFYCSEVARMGAVIAKEQHLDNEQLEAMSNEHCRVKMSKFER